MLTDLLDRCYRDEIDIAISSNWDAGWIVSVAQPNGEDRTIGQFSVGAGPNDCSTSEVMWDQVTRFIARTVIQDRDNLEDRAPVDAGCFECTAGTVPNRLNTGLCAYHFAKHKCLKADHDKESK